MRRTLPPRFIAYEEPGPETPGVARAEWQVNRGVRPPLRIVSEARTDHAGPMVTVHQADGTTWRAGVVWAALRWTEGEGSPDLTLGWPGKPNHGRPTYAMVSDALLLASDRRAQRAVRAFWDTLPPLGRTPGSTTIQDDEQLRGPVREMRRDRIRVTRPALAARSGFTEAEIRGYLDSTGRSFTEFIASF